MKFKLFSAKALLFAKPFSSKIIDKASHKAFLSQTITVYVNYLTVRWKHTLAAVTRHLIRLFSAALVYSSDRRLILR